MRTRRTLALVTTLAIGSALAIAADPPDLMQYQGVLRNLANQTLNGTFDMELRLWDAASAGNEILIDRHTGAGGVAVTDGLFSVELGGGAVSDGFSPGIYTSLADVFRDFGTVYLEVTVGADTLTPRTRIIAAGSALNARALTGLPASAFLDTSSTAGTKPARLTVDDGSNAAGYGFSAQTAGVAAVLATQKTKSGAGYLGYADIGVWGRGNYAGGFFQAGNGTGSALLGYGNTGIQGDGRSAGAQFTQSDYNGLATVAQDGIGGSFYATGTGSALTAYHDYGIQARGTSPGAGARFADPYYTGYAFLGDGSTGILAWGNYQGGEFYDTDSPGHAWIGIGGTGVAGQGSYAADYYYGAGGYFQDVSGNGQAWLARGDWGADGYGNFTGGDFGNAYSSSLNRTSLAYGGRGISGFGYYTGGDHTGHYGGGQYNNIAWVAYHSAVPDTTSYTIFGFEPKAFIQNDPADARKSVVYVALEGDESGTYTRGQARLQGGVAHVRLDRAFALVTNPDIGLTASLTPRQATVPLFVDTLSSDELVVRGPKDAGDVAFDYVVFGLRLGFETHAPVQERAVEGAPHVRADFPDADRPETGNALARWSDVRRSVGETTPVDLSRTEALIALARRPGTEPRTGAPQPQRDSAAGSPQGGPAGGLLPAIVPVAVSDAVRAGDLLATDPADPGHPFVLASALAEQTVVGIAAADSSEGSSGAPGARSAPLALAGSIVSCHADATVAPIAAGDLLVASSIPGHVKRAPAHAEPGTVAARALEPLSGGTGTIRVRVVTQ
jgi:hypothetical protein